MEFITDDILELRTSIDKGIVLIGVSKGKVCDHNIYLEIDKNFSIRNTYSENDALRFDKKKYPYILNLEAF